MPIDLPEPSADELAHSERVAAAIRIEIVAAGGAIDFSRYMELALYAPGLGYYSAGARKFGAEGDFVTAPELGFVFARCLARALAPTLRETSGDVLELGPGSGALAADLLAELERLDALPRRYRLLERSADLRGRQREHLTRACRHLVSRVEWLDTPPTEAWRGALVANEVIDALPVRRFVWRAEGLDAATVAVDPDRGGFRWAEVAADAALVAAVEAAVAGQASLPRPYRSEVCTLLAPWLAGVTETLADGIAVFADYGATGDEYYRPERRDGTLRCHWRHRAHDDPLRWPGLQDITAWVDFDALDAAARAAGLVALESQTQAAFLISHGLDEVFAVAYAQCADEAERYRLAQQVKRLTLPGEMGERFRVVTYRRR